MGSSAEAEPVEIIAHDGMVIVTGFGDGQILLTAQAAERLAYKISGAAFAAASWTTHVVREEVQPHEWRRAKHEGAASAPDPAPPRRRATRPPESLEAKSFDHP